MTDYAQLADKDIKALARIVGEENLSLKETDLIANARDNWPGTIIDVRDGRVRPRPDIVVRPGTAEEVAALLQYASKAKLPIVPYAEGSGVCGGVIPLHGGISLDVKRLNRFLDLDRTSQLARAEGGINGEKLERLLAREGYTLGHFPSSIYTSTLGGWLATRSAGQLSSLYGKIEDMVEALEVALPDGRIARQRAVPARATGPDWRGLFVGSEGTLGVITAATMKVHRAPTNREFAAYLFPDLVAGLDTFRELLQLGCKPAVMRLYDAVDTYIAGASGGGKATEKATEKESPSESRRLLDRELVGSFYDVVRDSTLTRSLRFLVGGTFTFPGLLNRVASLVPKHCKCILLFEGDAERTALEKEIAHELALKTGAKDLGEEPARHWLERRYAVSYRQQVVFDNFAFADTMEVASTWERLPKLYLKVREALGRHCLVMAHFSHAYHEGCSIYFTFVGAGPTRQISQARYKNAWNDALQAAVDAGGTITHHHGVGLSKAAFMAQEHGATLRFLQEAKAYLDPEWVMNPGKLGLA